jgi:hypothetical protein
MNQKQDHQEGRATAHDRVTHRCKNRCLAYNLFSRKGVSDIYCAVPEDQAVPVFVDHAWQFAGALHQREVAPGGLHPEVAAASVRMNGHYVFMRYDLPSERRTHAD